MVCSGDVRYGLRIGDQMFMICTELMVIEIGFWGLVLVWAGRPVGGECCGDEKES